MIHLLLFGYQCLISLSFPCTFRAAQPTARLNQLLIREKTEKYLRHQMDWT
jgi:hypothetical protein